MRKWNHLFFFQDQADVYVKELPIPDTLEKLDNRGKGAMMSFWCNVNNYINSKHALHDEILEDALRLCAT